MRSDSVEKDDGAQRRLPSLGADAVAAARSTATSCSIRGQKKVQGAASMRSRRRGAGVRHKLKALGLDAEASSVRSTPAEGNVRCLPRIRWP